MSNWGELIGFLDQLVADGAHGHGYQLCVIDLASGGPLVDTAGGNDGLQRPLTPTTTNAMYCAAKSLMALVIADLVEIGELSWVDRVGDVLPGCSSPVGATTVEALLTHRSGVSRPTQVEGTTLPARDRVRYALTQPGGLEPLASDETLYTEAAAWVVLGALVAELTGASPTGAAVSHVLEPLGLLDEFDLDAQQPDRRRIAVSLRRSRPVPLLLEQTEQFAFATNPGYGGFATARGLAQLHAVLVRMADQDSAGALGELLVAEPVRYDRALKRPCRFSKGFAASLAGHGFVGFSDRAIGQAGLLGMTTLVADASMGVSAAVHVNGLLDAETSIGWLRPAIWKRLAAAASLSAQTPTTAPGNGVPPAIHPPRVWVAPCGALKPYS